MTATGIRKPAAHAARPASWAARLAWLHLRSRRAPAALTALLACGAALGASLHYHWWLGTGNAADEMPMILQGCAAGIIAVTAHSPFGEPERAVGWRLAVLRAGLVLALCGAAIGFFALGAAAAYSPRSGVDLAGGILPVARNVLGMTGIGLTFCLVTGALIAWTGPLAFTAISQFALIASYSEPLTWPTRPPADRGGWIAAMVAFAVGLVAFTIRGPRIRHSGELRPADGQRFRGKPKVADKRTTNPSTRTAYLPAAPGAPGRRARIRRDFRPRSAAKKPDGRSASPLYRFRPWPFASLSVPRAGPGIRGARTQGGRRRPGTAVSQPVSAGQRHIVRAGGERAVKPSASPTMVRTHHLPRPAETAR